jgi:hypothetical protein
MQGRILKRRTLALTAALASVVTPLAAAAQPPGAYWTGDICHQPQPAAGQGALKCLAYPPRIETHEHNCRWVEDVYGGGAHQFEVCRDPVGVWRPSGRS